MCEVGSDESLYRRIPVREGWYDAARHFVAPEAFRPHKSNDPDGLSLSRGYTSQHPDFFTPERAAIGPSPNGYYVAELLAGDLQQAEVLITTDPLPDNPGHVLLPELNSASRTSDRVAELKQWLAKMVRRVHGPFPRPP